MMVTLILRCSAPSFYPDHGRRRLARYHCKFNIYNGDKVFSNDSLFRTSASNNPSNCNERIHLAV